MARLISTPNAERCRWHLERAFGELVISYYNCRHISNDPRKPWSQHAAYEPQYGYHGNALDIMEDSPVGLDGVAAWLEARRSEFSIRQILWQVAGHYDHVHVDFWPIMKDDWWYPAPCENRRNPLVVIHRNGILGSTFGPPFDPELEGGSVMFNEWCVGLVEAWAEDPQRFRDTLEKMQANDQFGGDIDYWVNLLLDATNPEWPGFVGRTWMASWPNPGGFPGWE